MEIFGLHIYTTADLEALKKTDEGFKNLDNSAKDAKNSLFNLSKIGKIGVTALATGFVGAAASVTKLQESFRLVNLKLSSASRNEDELNASMGALFEVSQKLGINLKDTADIYYNLSNATLNAAVSQRDLIEITQTLGNTMRISGANSLQSELAISKFSNALSDGVVSANEFESVINDMPRLAKLISDSLNISVGELKNLASGGKLTTEVFVNSIKEQSSVINAEVSKIPPTFSEAITNVKTSLSQLILDFSKSIDIAGGLSSKIDEFATIISNNRAPIIEFGTDILRSYKMASQGVLILREGIVSGFELIYTGISNATGFVSDKINELIAMFESAYNQISSFFGAEVKKFDRVDLMVDLGIEDSSQKLNSAIEKTDGVIAKRSLNLKKYKDDVIKTFNDIAEFTTKLDTPALSDVKRDKTPILEKKTKPSKKIQKDTLNDRKKELDRQIEYYKAIFDLTNQRLKEREKESIRLRELGLNDTQIHNYFLRLQTKEEQEAQKERLQSLERYYELLGEKRLAAQQRMQIQTIELKEQGYSSDDISNMVYGKEQQKSNYDSINTILGVDTGVAGGFMDKLAKIDEFYAMEQTRIDEHYALAEDKQKAHIERTNALDRLQMQTRMATAGVSFDALGGLAKMFYDASNGENKTALRAYQAMMVGKAIVNTYTAATNAYASAGNPYLGAVLAAVAIAQGMAQVAMIKAQKFHTGGMVGSLARDEVPAILQTGEYILSRKQVSDLKDNGNSGSGSNNDNGGVIIVNTLDSSIFEQWADSRNGRRVIKNVIGGK